MPRSVDSLRVSTLRSLYSSDVSRVRKTEARASGAPACRARAQAQRARSRCSFTGIRFPPLAARAADRDRAIDLDRRLPKAHRHALSVLPTCPAADGELEIVAHHRHVFERLRPVADEVDVLDRRRELAVLDQVAGGDVEAEIAGADLHLTVGEVHGVDPLLHRLDD